MALTYKVLNSNFEKMNGKSLAGSETFGGGKVGQNIISVVFDIKYKDNTSVNFYRKIKS